MPAPTLEKRVEDLESEVFRLGRRADHSDDTLGSLMAGINQITTEIHQVDANLGRSVLDVAQGCDRIERMAGDLSGRMDRLEGRMDRLEGRMAGLEERFGGLEGRQEALEERMGNLEREVGEVKGLLAQVLARLGG